MALRPNNAPKIVAPTDSPVWSFCWDACAVSRSTDAAARRRCSSNCACFDAYFLRTASTAASRATRCASRTPDLKVAFALAWVRRQLQIALAHQLELLGLREPARRDPCSTPHSSSPATLAPAPLRMSPPAGRHPADRPSRRRPVWPWPNRRRARLSRTAPRRSRREPRRFRASHRQTRHAPPQGRRACSGRGRKPLPARSTAECPARRSGPPTTRRPHPLASGLRPLASGLRPLAP